MISRTASVLRGLILPGSLNGIVIVPARVAVLASLLTGSGCLQAQTEDWYGIALPPALVPHGVPALIGDRGPAPAVVPPGEEEWTELRGERISEDLRSIVGFSLASRQQQELGGNQMWGRVSGFPSGAATVDWAAQQFRDAGISDVRVQEFDQEADASVWLPVNWEVRLLADPLFGAGARDVVLTTAIALAPSAIPGGSLTAPIVYVGTGSPAELAHIDVAGKIAIQLITPQGHLVFERDEAVPRARDIMSRGAVAVVNIVELPGNEMARDLANCGGPCFNLGGRDGQFLTQVIDRAAQAGALDRLRMRLSLEAREFTGLSARNAVAIIPGRSPGGENIVLNAHVDAWFDGAGDNGDGLAVLVAMARHFSRPEIQLDRNLVLIASAGHHSSGLNGPRNAVAMNPQLFQSSLLIFNLEHVAQRNFSPARSVYADGYREFVADAGEAPIVAGVTNSAPFLEQLFDQGVERYGTNFVSAPSTMASGEGGGYRAAGVPIVTTMQAPPLYHTSGEVFEVVSTPGLERMARFVAFFVKQVDQAEASLIDP